MTDLEAQLVKAFPTYALDQLRRRLLFSAVSNRVPADGARAVFQMANETEIGAMVSKLFPIPADVAAETLAVRRSYAAIAADLATYGFLLGPALDELEVRNGAPPAYSDMVRRHLGAPSPRYRVAAASAIVCVEAALLIPPPAPPPSLSHDVEV